MAKKPAGKRPKKPVPRLTPKQKKLVAQMPAIAAGEKTKKAALLDAGYSESTANQQARIFGEVRNNVRMQEALRKAGVTEEALAEAVKEGIGATRLISINFRTHEIPDFHARHSFVKTGAELLDAFPSKKIDITDKTPVTYGDLERPKAKTLDEAKELAEQAGEWDEQ